MSEILTAETAYADPDIVPDPSFRDERHPVSRRAAIINARAFRLVLHPNPATVEDVLVHARIEHGRWIVDCPFCRGAQYASEDDQTFLCADCFNRAVEGHMIRVLWPAPDVRAAIEEHLLTRPNAVNRNWLPHESVDDLVREFEAHADSMSAGPVALVDPIAFLTARLDALERRLKGSA